MMIENVDIMETTDSLEAEYNETMNRYRSITGEDLVRLCEKMGFKLEDTSCTHGLILFTRRADNITIHVDHISRRGTMEIKSVVISGSDGMTYNCDTIDFMDYYNYSDVCNEIKVEIDNDHIIIEDSAAVQCTLKHIMDSVVNTIFNKLIIYKHQLSYSIPLANGMRALGLLATENTITIR